MANRAKDWFAQAERDLAQAKASQMRLLNSSVSKWPDQRQVDAAVRDWVVKMVDQHPELIKLGYFGSYARGDWDVGSDLDLIAIVSSSETQFSRRPLAWDLLKLPVPAEIVIYTRQEWQKLQAEGRRLTRVVANEAVWVYGTTDEEK